MTDQAWRKNFLQPLAFGSFRNWLELLRENGGVDPVYRRRALFVTLTSFLTSPLRLYERARYVRSIKSTPISEPPIFIIGHWRSGTTHLHNLLSQDANFGCVTAFQAIAPEAFLVGQRFMRPLVDWLMPDKRPMDNMALSIDGPLEEEWALANVSPYSFYHYWSFPRTARQHFERYALFQDTPENVVTQWKESYTMLLRKATFKARGKRLLLKNPVNTGRIALLLDLFPDAKFIHIYRNPYIVFSSTLHFYKKMLSLIYLQEGHQSEIEADVLRFYTAMMRKFWAEKALIPAGNFVEVKFEDLEADPLAETQRIYATLGLSGFATAETHFRTYITSQKDYRKNSFPLNDEIIRKVDRHWNFAVEAWGYRPQ